MARFTTAGGEGSGAPGPQGPAGDSAYDIAVENGFVGTEQEWLDSFGGTANIADFVFNYDEEGTDSTITIHNHDMVIQTTRDSDEDSDISLNSADDIWINATDDIEVTAANSIYLNAVNGVYLGTADEEEYNPNNQVATIGDIQQGTTGDITFSGVQIIGAGTAAGDGSGNGTMELVPDGDLTSNQYLIIDPTGPNHIHIRAGGNIDESTADLILGGERNKVAVSDSYKSVAITTAATITNTYVNAHEADNEDLIVPETSDILIGDSIVIAGINHPVTYFSPDPNNTGFSIVRATGLTFVAGESYTFVREEPYENSWQFGSDGVLSGPAMGGVKVPGIMNAGVGSDLLIASNDANIQMIATNHVRLDASNGNVYLNPSGGIYLGTSEVAENEIATMGDISSAGTGDITFVDSTISNNTGDDIVIQNTDSNEVVKARITLDQGNEQVLIEAINTNSNTFTTADWTTATWSGNVIQITGTENGVIPFFSNVSGNVTHIQVNGGDLVQYDGASYGPTDLTMYTMQNAPVGSDPVTITSLTLISGVSSKINIDYDGGDFQINANGMAIDMSSTDDVTINAGGDDLRLSAFDDITFTSGYNSEGDQYEWRMNNTGRFELPASGYIENLNGASSDGNNNDVLHLVPDFNLVDDGSDQYLIIEPTFGSPNHLHLRAGGTIDESDTDIIIGGEKNSLIVSDTERFVAITSRSPLITNTYLNTNTETSNQMAIVMPADVSPNYTVNVGGTDYIVDSVNSIDEGVIGVTAGGAVFEPNTNYTFTYDGNYTNNWQFSSDGTLYGPTDPGFVKVNGLYGQNDSPLSILGPQSVVISGDGGEFLNDPSDPDNQIATVRDIVTAVPQSIGQDDSPSFNQIYITNSDGTGQNVKVGDDAWIGDVNLANYVGITGVQDSTEAGIVLGSALENRIYTDGSGLTLQSTTGDMNFYMDGAAYIGDAETDNRIVTVGELNGAITDAEPDEVSFTVNGGTLGTQPTFTGDPLFSGSYVKTGKLVHFQIQVDMDNITSFGTGQYYVDLPFPAKYGYQVREGCLHDISADKQYAIGGHVLAGESRLKLFFTDTNGQDQEFDHNSPVTLAVADNFHVSGTYITN